jgi:hypothetical protein
MPISQVSSRGVHTSQHTSNPHYHWQHHIKHWHPRAVHNGIYLIMQQALNVRTIVQLQGAEGGVISIHLKQACSRHTSTTS